MQAQFSEYGITSKPFLVERFTDIQYLYAIFKHEFIDSSNMQPGHITSFLRCIKKWYDTGEPYAIFCEDDIDFSSINYWSFTWNEFMDNLPSDWECVQLIRIQEWLGDTNLIAGRYEAEEQVELNLRQRRWDDWGSSFLLSREYAKKLLDRHYIDEYTFNLNIPCPDWSLLYPVVEHLLYRNLGVVYNVPILFENTQFDSTNLTGWINSGGKIEDWHKKSYHHKVSAYKYKQKWQDAGLTTSIQEIMGK
jgi:hypothetical protein